MRLDSLRKHTNAPVTNLSPVSQIIAWSFGVV